MRRCLTQQRRRLGDLNGRERGFELDTPGEWFRRESEKLGSEQYSLDGVAVDP